MKSITEPTAMTRLHFDDPRAQKILDSGDVLALPTETVYGLGVKWDNPDAYEKLCLVKNRRPDKPIAVMVGTNFKLDDYFEITPAIQRVIDAFLPGPLTILVKAKSNCPQQTHLGTFVAGIRIPGSPELLDFLNHLHYPLQVTSANISGQPALTLYKDVHRTFKNDPSVLGIVPGKCDSLVPTTVVDLTGDKPVLVRQGEITLDLIADAFFASHSNENLALGCDHGGFAAKEAVKKHLQPFGYHLIDCGTFSAESCNYPEFAFAAATKVSQGEAKKGILICSSGEGVAICANKVKGIRCGIGYNDTVADLMVAHDHANMIAFGAKYMDIKDILHRTDIFLHATPLPERHATRVQMIVDYENKHE
jgi:tRNA threonylcarbamoyl adenosine modification protein (Sua5/YciO/YrdC/YwlC family)